MSSSLRECVLWITLSSMLHGLVLLTSRGFGCFSVTNRAAVFMGQFFFFCSTFGLYNFSHG